ncbi:MAG TPA: maleylpyruvate isomerase family mycothiol-dependent enzyme [Actinopolymorphaceae bacterium]|nr:maleylpyruvate isomerase family mycothiol-dependent enzyme [Actinopolymorphaceae bacterium]
MTSAKTTDLTTAIAAERQELAGILAGLSATSWNAPTLCVGWRVREVVAHITMPFRYAGGHFVAELLKAGGNFHKMADRSARRDASVLSTEELTAALRDNAHHPWKPPGAGQAGALSHDVIHGLDVTVALGIERRVPADRLLAVLATADSGRARRHFGVDLHGIELRADDLDWTLGSGEPLGGSAQDLLLVLCGRRLPPGRLHGEPAGRFTAAADSPGCADIGDI